MLRYRQNNKIRTKITATTVIVRTETTTTIIVIIKILTEKTDGMICKISIQLKRFIKEYVVLSFYHENF